MAKRFSIVNIKDEEVFLRGYVEPKDLSKSQVVVSIMTEVPNYTLIPVTIQHCLFLDFPDNDEDISLEDLEGILDVFDDLVNDEYIYLEELLELELPGLNNEDDVFIEE